MTSGGYTLFQEISLIMVLVMIIINIRWFRKDKSKRYISMLMLLWLTHLALFYTTLLFVKSGAIIPFTVRFTDWSSILRWHTIVTFFTIDIGRVMYHKTMKLRGK